MRILHYTLGFTPSRSGGLVSYATDLMGEQKRKGHNVYALYPGNLDITKNDTFIKIDNRQIVDSYQIINSLPLPLFGGIKKPSDFMVPVSRGVYLDFFQMILPDVIHVHTLMGIHREFFEAAKILNIPIVFTSHDYFGLAAEPNFYYDGHSYHDTNTTQDWINASERAYSTKKLRLFQLRFYPIIKKFGQIFDKHKGESYAINKRKLSIQEIQEYENLRNYYQSILDLIEKFHFNSTIAKNVYEKNMSKNFQYEIITISNSRIKHNEKKVKKSEKVRVAYIGPNKECKGINDFFLFAEKMGKYKELEFHSYGHIPVNKSSKVIQHGIYNSNQMDMVFQNIDIVIVPSRWKETFGLVVLEAMSFGKKVFASRNVGASELLEEGNKFTNIVDLSKDMLLKDIESKFYSIHIKRLTTHENEIYELYQEMVN
ncbi:Glycosyltransferase involved in cell wall bisynthesis [Enterococcus malodoratus]|uniref:glycosyltransferase n=1 Tax=Enterococcus malodoratus TaxID=71451 RepID=UPI0008CD4EF0|nr:glycosyltransferase [Enterococcus malodoratus]SES96656.1 Glycosyltransferase involved in cell wall bisynthesis [Enterococcus malodoratus]